MIKVTSFCRLLIVIMLLLSLSTSVMGALSDGLVSAWQWKYGYDDYKKINNATKINSPAISNTSCFFNNDGCLTFTADPDSAVYTSVTGMSTGKDDRTIACWVLGYGSPTNDYRFIFDQGSSGANNEFGTFVFPNTHVLNGWDGGAIATTKTMVADSWGFVVGRLTKEGAVYNFSIWFNNTYGGYKDVSSLATGTTRFGIGTGSSGDIYNFGNGKFDDCYVWSRSLSTAEMTQIWNSGSGLPFDDVVGNIPPSIPYRMNMTLQNDTSNNVKSLLVFQTFFPAVNYSTNGVTNGTATCFYGNSTNMSAIYGSDNANVTLTGNLNINFTSSHNISGLMDDRIILRVCGNGNTKLPLDIYFNNSLVDTVNKNVIPRCNSGGYHEELFITTSYLSTTDINVTVNCTGCNNVDNLTVIKNIDKVYAVSLRRNFYLYPWEQLIYNSSSFWYEERRPLHTFDFAGSYDIFSKCENSSGIQNTSFVSIPVGSVNPRSMLLSASAENGTFIFVNNVSLEKGNITLVGDCSHGIFNSTGMNITVSYVNNTLVKYFDSDNINVSYLEVQSGKSYNVTLNCTNIYGNSTLSSKYFFVWQNYSISILTPLNKTNISDTNMLNFTYRVHGVSYSPVNCSLYANNSDSGSFNVLNSSSSIGVSESDNFLYYSFPTEYFNDTYFYVQCWQTNYINSTGVTLYIDNKNYQTPRGLINYSSFYEWGTDINFTYACYNDTFVYNQFNLSYVNNTYIGGTSNWDNFSFFSNTTFLVEGLYNVKLLRRDNASKTNLENHNFTYNDTVCPSFSWIFPRSDNTSTSEILNISYISASVFDLTLVNASLECCNNTLCVFNNFTSTSAEYIYFANQTINITSQGLIMCNFTARDSNKVCSSYANYSVVNTSLPAPTVDVGIAVSELKNTMFYIFLTIIWAILLALGIFFMIIFMMFAGLFGIFMSFAFMHIVPTIAYIFIVVNAMIFLISAVLMFTDD